MVCELQEAEPLGVREGACARSGGVPIEDGQSVRSGRCGEHSAAARAWRSGIAGTSAKLKSGFGKGATGGVTFAKGVSVRRGMGPGSGTSLAVALAGLCRYARTAPRSSWSSVLSVTGFHSLLAALLAAWRGESVGSRWAACGVLGLSTRCATAHRPRAGPVPLALSSGADLDPRKRSAKSTNLWATGTGTIHKLRRTSISASAQFGSPLFEVYSVARPRD